MKLYELLRNSTFQLVDDPEKTDYVLETIDGMYSRCYYKEHKDRGVIHIAAYTEVTQGEVPNI